MVRSVPAAADLRMPAWQRWAAVLDRLLPGACLLCEASITGDAALCVACHGDLPLLQHACPVCALPTLAEARVCGRCLKRKPEFERLFAALRYAWPANLLVSRLKFQGQFAVLRAIMPLLRELAAHPALTDAAHCLVVPVPLAKRRLASRGYNQAQLLAEAWQGVAGGELRHALMRVRETTAQVGQPRLARARNVRGAFVADRAQVQDQDILLVDDVVTTAATVRSCTKTLLQAGARRVRVLALARAWEPGADR